MQKRLLNQKDPVYIYFGGLVISLIGALISNAVFPNGGNAYVYFAYLIPQISYVISIFGYTQVMKINLNFRIKKDFSEKPINMLWALLVGIGVFFGALLPSFGFQKLYSLLDKSISVTMPVISSVGDYALATVVMCIIPAVVEEILFRKVIIDGMDGLGKINTVIICGLIFSLAHLSLAQTLHQFVIGCVLAIIYIKTKNILMPMIIHLVNNLLAVYLGTSSIAGVFDNIYVLLICCFGGIILALAGLFLLFSKTEKLDNVNRIKFSNLLLGMIILLALLWAVSVLIS